MKILLKAALFIGFMPGICFAQVGIGTSSPQTSLQISSGTAQNDVYGYVQANYTGTDPLKNSGYTAKNYSGTSQFMQWENNGVRIGSRITTNTGLGNLYFTAGTDDIKMFVGATGNVGIGTTSPSSLLDLTATTPKLTLTPSNYSGNYRTVLGARSGSQGVLQLGNNDENFIVAGNNSTGGFLSFYVNASSDFITTTSGTLAMRITNDGKVGIGTTSPDAAYLLHVNGAAYSSVAWVNASDIRLKNITELIPSADNINTIKYDWKDGRDDRVHFGYGAQEVEKILPDAVYTGTDGIKSVNYDEVHTYKLMQQELLIKELQQQIMELQKIVKRKRRIK